MNRYYTCQCGYNHYCINVLNELGESIYFSKTIWPEGVAADKLEQKLIERAKKAGIKFETCKKLFGN